MIETLISSIIIGQVITGPNLIQTDYLNPETNQVITIQETIQEVPQ